MSFPVSTANKNDNIIINVLNKLIYIYLSEMLIGEIGDKSRFKPLNPLTRYVHAIVLLQYNVLYHKHRKCPTRTIE